MEATPITQELAKHADTGTAAIILMIVVLFVLCWPRIVDGIERLRGRKTTIDNDPINVNKLDKYVSRGEFNQRMEKVDGDIAGVRSEVSALRSDITNSNRAVIDNLDELDKRRPRDRIEPPDGPDHREGRGEQRGRQEERKIIMERLIAGGISPQQAAAFTGLSV